LTYTSFKYSNLGFKKNQKGNDVTLTVSFDITNSGNYDSDEVPQVYIGYPGSATERPVKALKGFKRVFIKKGETKKITIDINSADLATWNVKLQKWVNEFGRIKLSVGSSSADIRLEGEYDL
jgi:beta-glucosidase